MIECQIEVNRQSCTCTYEPCERKGKCCDCISHHRAKNELPGCLFPPEAERTYDRSFRKFIEIYGKRR
jgi:hypothetical protein